MIRTIAVALLALSLAACRSDGDGAPAAKAPRNAGPSPGTGQASLAGIWTGVDSKGLPVTAYSTDDGSIHWRGSFGQTAVSIGGLVTGESLVLTLLLVHPLQFDGSPTANCSMTGTFETRQSLTLDGTCTPGAGGDAFDLSLTFDYDDEYERGSSLTIVEGTYSNLGVDVLTVDPAGAVFMQMSVLGCVVNGQISIIDARWNAYEVSATYSNCESPLELYNDVPLTGTVFLHEEGNVEQLVGMLTGQAGMGTLVLPLHVLKI